MILVGNRVNFRLEIPCRGLATQLGSLLALPALHQTTAFNDGAVVTSFENMRINQPFEPRFFPRAVEPRVKSRFRAGSKQRLVAGLYIILDHMRASHAS